MAVDARGLSCPQPVMMTKKALDSKPETCQILVDNPVAKENVSRFAENAGYRVAVEQQGEDFLLTLAR